MFSGGKDSAFSAYLAKKHGYKILCLISVFSHNPDSYMFHTPCIEKVKKQAELMKTALITRYTTGIKEKELIDLKKAIKEAVEKHEIEGVVTGAVESAYQASRVQKICDSLDIECFNPLWQKKQVELLRDIIRNNFEVIITGVNAYPLNEKWLGKKIDYEFIRQVIGLKEKYQINPAGEGGEFETFVINCPLFTKPIEILDKKIIGEKNSWRMEIKLNDTDS